MMFVIEKFGNRKVSFERDDLELNIDIWGEGEWFFSPEFANELYVLWNVYLTKPMGEPTQSRKHLNFGYGSDPKMPCNVNAQFLCKEDLDDYEAQARKALKKDASYVSYKALRKQAEEDAKKAKAERDKIRKEALNPSKAVEAAEDILNTNKDDGKN